MKLLRLTSDAIDGTFNGFLNQEIEIAKQGQIALQSATFEVTDRALKIDGSNDTIQFQTSNAAGTQSIVLDHTDGTGTNVEQYDSTNLQVFFDDMTNKINSQFAITRNSQIGKQFRIKSHTDGKVQASFQSSAFQNRAGELTANISTAQVNGVNNAPTLAKTAADLLGNISTTDNQVGATQYQAFTNYSFPVTKGCGLVRLKIARFTRIDATHHGGFTIALSRRNPHTATAAFTTADIVAGIQVLSFEAVAANTVYSTITNGVVTPNALRADQFKVPGSANDDNRNDYIELCVTTNNAAATANGRDIQMNVYRRANDVDAVPNFSVNTLATTPYATDAQEGDNLYAYIFLHGSQPTGGNFTCRLSTPRFTADPFLENAVNPVFRENVVDHGELGTKPQPPRNPNTIHSINFGDDSVYEWLGYSVAQPPAVASRDVEFTANVLFGSKMIAEAFLVQLLNLPVEAYDTFKEGRENLLAVIPKSDEDLNVIYEPNSLYFIDLNNNFPIKLSNLRLRILRQDYSQVQTRGLNSVVLFIKSPEE